MLEKYGLTTWHRSISNLICCVGIYDMGGQKQNFDSVEEDKTYAEEIEEKPSINACKLLLYVFLYLVSCIIPMIITFFISYFSLNILNHETTIKALFNDHLANGLLCGVITIVCISGATFLIHWKKVDSTWKSFVSVLSRIFFAALVLTLIILCYCTLTIPLGENAAIAEKLIPTVEFTFFIECISTFICVVLQCFTHPESFVSTPTL